MKTAVVVLHLSFGLVLGCSSASADDDPTGSGGKSTASAGASSNAGSPAAGGSNGSTAGSGGASAAGSGGTGGSTTSSGGTSSGGTGGISSGGTESENTGGAAGPGMCSTGSWPVADLPAEGTEGLDYLSDLTPTSIAVFEAFGSPASDGPVGMDQSYSGKALVINGVCYPKGIGVHTYTEINYNLGGAYKQFVADTGLDELEDSATMIFELKVDDELVYDGGNVISTKTDKVTVTVDLTGKNKMQLYVRDSFDDANDDFGVWGGARITK